MKDLKHIKRFNESQENLNISDVSNSKLKINEMANTHKTKEELVNYLVELLSHSHIREDFRKNLMSEDDDFVLYILNNLVDDNTNNILRSEDF
jgi:hypothetical protein